MTINQILLSLQPHTKKTFSNFFSVGNEVIVNHLKQLSQTSTLPNTLVQQVYLWGMPAAGKSHLLQAGCQAAGQAGLRSTYLPLAKIISHGTDILSGLADLEIICIDDFDLVLTRPEWQSALFQFINNIYANNSRLIIAGKNNPLHLEIEFKDLHSRLVWGLVHKVQPLSDQHKYTALCELAKHTNSTLAEEAIRYLLNTCPRDLGQLTKMMEQLDYRAKQLKKNRVTIPFIKDSMEDIMRSIPNKDN